MLTGLGYGPRDAAQRTVIRSALGAEPGYLLRVTQFSSLGFRLTDHIIHAHELPDQYDLDGLLGLRFLHHFDYTVHSRRGEITAELAAAP